MGLQLTDFFDNTNYESADTQIIICKECSSHLCLSHLVISESFQGSSGPAVLVDRLINYKTDPVLQESKMLTGVYLINKVLCRQCLQTIGWTYKKSFNYAEAYKEGKFVIERKFIKLIPNNSSTANLIEQAKLSNRRRRLSTKSLSSASSLEDGGYSGDFKFNTIPETTKPKSSVAPANSAIRITNIYSGSGLGRLNYRGLDKDDFDEGDEDDNVFVDV